jgi:lysozyme
MNLEKLKERLIQVEGEILRPYWDEIGGTWTGGVGHNMGALCTVEELSQILHDKKITPEQSRIWLESDIDEALTDCKKLFCAFDDFSASRQSALVELRFNLGPNRFRGFHRMCWAVISKNWSLAAHECLDSRAARQLPIRYNEIAEMLRRG